MNASNRAGVNASFGQNLSDVLVGHANVDAHGLESCGALGQRQGQALSLRTIVTRIWGVSDPHQLNHWATIGGWQHHPRSRS